MKTITNITYPALALLALGCFALAPSAQAVCQDACLTNDNTVQGDDALISPTTGVANTAIGANALQDNTAGNSNTAIGASVLSSNTIGNNNTATGVSALQNTTTGSDNTANGYQAIDSNTTGSSNTASGFEALLFNTTGNNNIALGANAGINLTTGSHNIYIGNGGGGGGESRKIRIGTAGTHGAAFIAGISGATVPTGVPVIVDTTGHLGTTTSSARFKEAIKPMDNVSEAILALKPITFRYKHELDPDGVPQFGLVAEDVEKINPDLVARDEQGKPYTVRYEAVNAMLLNEFLKEHKAVQEIKSTAAKQEATIAEFKKEIADLTATVREQAAQIQKVSGQIEVTKPAPQIVADNH